ncbi:membrane-flanked domain [Beggiatoa sp. PS]|nr:membrane-flanked domain [Beggiatoa sp. PS]
MIMSGYLLIVKPFFIVKTMPTVSLWLPNLLSRNSLEVSVWYLCLIVLFLIGILMLWEAFIVKQTTEFAITSRRILFKCGLISKTIIEIKLRRFESIMINQGPLGIIFDYGTITVTGMGGLKTTVPNIMEPEKFKKVLWQVLDEYVEQQRSREDYN